MIDFIVFIFWSAVWVIGGIILLAIASLVFGYLKENTEEAKLERAVREERVKLNKLKQDEAKQEHDRWFEQNLHGWSNQSRCWREGGVQPLSGACILASSDETGSLRLVEYTLGSTFEVKLDVQLMPDEIKVVDLIYPKVMKTVVKKQFVPVTTKKGKSPVARGLAGGMLLGPAGMVLGAASGLGGDTKTKVEERKVTERVEVTGKPHLVVGIKNAQVSLLKLTFSPHALAEEWLYRIKTLM